jgi:hypothetical protein
VQSDEDDDGGPGHVDFRRRRKRGSGSKRQAVRNESSGLTPQVLCTRLVDTSFVVSSSAKRLRDTRIKRSNATSIAKQHGVTNSKAEVSFCHTADRYAYLRLWRFAPLCHNAT